jgi:hypothetical protein
MQRFKFPNLLAFLIMVRELSVYSTIESSETKQHDDETELNQETLRDQAVPNGFTCTAICCAGISRHVHIKRFQTTAPNATASRPCPLSLVPSTAAL